MRQKFFRWPAIAAAVCGIFLFAGIVTAAAPQAAHAQPTTVLPGSDQDSTSPTLECATLSGSPFKFLGCPLVDLFQEAVNGLNAGIDAMLTINTSDAAGSRGIFTPTYRAAFDQFRLIAIGLIVIASLVMIASQALGFEFIDAYTVKKVLPRLVIVAIFLALLWPLLKFAVELSNDLGNSVRAIIYQPFKGSLAGTAFGSALEIGNFGAFVSALVSAAALFTLGLAAVLSFGATALLAVFIGFVILLARQIIITMLVLTAPFAVACYVLPNTQKAFDFWRGTFISMLVVFPIISAFIAAGRVFALVAYNNGGGGDISIIQQLTAFIAFFLPYFALPFAFRLAGGAIATLAGLVNDRSRGGFDRLKNYRAQQPAKRWAAFKGGELYNGSRRGPLGFISRRTNALGRRVDLGVRGNFGVGAKGRHAAAIRGSTEIAETLKNNPQLQELANNDDANAVLAFSGGTKAGARTAARQLFDQSTAEGRVRAESALAAADLFLENDGKKNATAALQTVAQNKSRAVSAGRADIVAEGIDRITQGNAEQFQQLAYGYQYHSRSSGRADLGGNWMSGSTITQANAAAAAAAASGATREQQEVVRRQTISDLTMIDGIARTGVSDLVRGHSGQITQLVGNENGSQQGVLERMLRSQNAAHREQAAVAVLELQKSLPYANGSSRDAINAFMARQANAATPGVTIPVDQTRLDESLVAIVNEAGGAGYIDSPQLHARARVYDQSVPLERRRPEE